MTKLLIDRVLLEEMLYALNYASDMTKPEGLSGCECPICTMIPSIEKALEQPDVRIPTTEESQDTKCNPHPKAPHGFNRNSSHNAGRYVCDCEGWDAFEAGYQEGLHAGISMGQQ